MMLGLVCNTGPLIALAMIDRLDLLKLLFREVLIPEAVHREIVQGGSASAGLSAYRQASWIKVKQQSASASKRSYRLNMHHPVRKDEPRSLKLRAFRASVVRFNFFMNMTQNANNSKFSDYRVLKILTEEPHTLSDRARFNRILSNLSTYQLVLSILRALAVPQKSAPRRHKERQEGFASRVHCIFPLTPPHRFYTFTP